MFNMIPNLTLFFNISTSFCDVITELSRSHQDLPSYLEAPTCNMASDSNISREGSSSSADTDDMFLDSPNVSSSNISTRETSDHQDMRFSPEDFLDPLESSGALTLAFRTVCSLARLTPSQVVHILREQRSFQPRRCTKTALAPSSKTSPSSL